MTNPKYKTLKFLLPAFMLATMAFVAPQSDVPKKLENYLATWRSQYSPEKVYVQHDKPYYAPGQHIWLSGLVLDAASLQPSAKSQVLYVDLLNAENQSVSRLKLKAENGKAKGDILLPQDIPAGTYRLTAYTQWMRNFGEESFFNKEIQILRGDEANEIAAPVSQEVDLQFFPEGGDLVQGLSSRVAFKGINPQGKGVSVKGTLIDDRGRKLLDFADSHLGMGAFVLQPEEGRRYLAKVKLPDGSIKEYPLPVAKARGYVLQVDETSDAGHVLVNVTGNGTDKESLVLTGISRDAMQFSETFSVQPGQPYRQKIAKAEFPSGITRFNLARASGEPLAERLVFVDRQDNLQVSLKTDKTRYAGRDRVTMEVEAKDAQGRPVAADFSLAVTDDELVTPDKHGLTIQAHLLLTSDLRGYVERPGYYFEGNDPKRARDLSYLLMTQGWRRFGWQESVAGIFPSLSFSPENDLAIRGKLVTNKGKAVPDGEVILYLKGQHEAFIITETDQNGNFVFDGFDFTGDVDVVVQGTDARGRRKNLLVKMDGEQALPIAPATPSQGAEGLLASAGHDFVMASQTQTAVENFNTRTLKGILLKDVVIQGKKSEIQEPFKLHNRADVVIHQRSLPVAPSGNILESLQGRVAGLQIYRTGYNTYRASIRGQLSPPLYLLDGVPVSEGLVMSLNQFDISRVEILKGPGTTGIYGGRGAGGVIAFFTRRGNEEPLEVESGTHLIIHRASGFSKVREFYSPKYGKQNPGSDQPDLRTTLYWNPSVKTNAEGKATVTFYTADRNTSYRAIAEGISDQGKPGRGVVTFGVNQGTAMP